MITAIIIDDEANAREFLEKLINRYFNRQLAVLASCDSVQSGVEAIKTHQPELVFLDIQMPEENGFELFKYFENIHFEVIFTTAYKDFAIDAIRHSALDYLLKPINHVDLLSALKRFQTHQEKRYRDERMALLLENLSQPGGEYHKVAFPSLKGYELQRLANILYCQSDSNYCKIKCLDGKEIYLSKTLKYVEKLIDSPLFFRIHKSYLVNLNYVANFTKVDELSVTLSNGEQLPVAVRKKEAFLDAILNKK